MPTHRIRLVTIVAEPALEARLTAEARALGASGFTVIEARGEGTRHGSRGVEVPGSNVRIEMLVPDAVARRVVDHLAAHYFADYSIVAWVADVDVVRTAKFHARGTAASAGAAGAPR